MHVYLNGKIVSKAEAVVSVYDHGFLYGDGIYETMRSYDGVVFRIDEHLGRLYRSASLIGLSVPTDMDGLKAGIYDTLLANNLKNAYVRLTVSRGYGPIGLDPELCPSPTLVIMAEPLKDYPVSFYEKGIKTVVANTRRNLKEAIDPRIKSLNFLNNILAKIEAVKAGAYEALMLNANGLLTEGTISNVFFVRGDVLCTSSIGCGILDGITRDIVIGLARKESIEVLEGEFKKDDLYSAREVFLTNTTMEVMPVSEVDGKRYEAGSVARLLHKAYRKEVEAYVSEVKASGPSLWGFNE